jgi:telomerase reverse transcriptase
VSKQTRPASQLRDRDTRLTCPSSFPDAFKIQSHLLFYDTSHNPRRTVLANLFAAFSETAVKMWAYARCLRTATAATTTSSRQQKGGEGGVPNARVLVDTLKTLIDVSYVLLTSRSRKERYPGYVCCVRKGEVSWYVILFLFFFCSLRSRVGYNVKVKADPNDKRLALSAFQQVLEKKQTRYGEFLAWIEEEIRSVEDSARRKKVDMDVLKVVARVER